MTCYQNQSFTGLQEECESKKDFAKGFLTGIFIGIAILGIQYLVKK